MKIDYLREFLVLAECLNYTEASRRCYISQSALSKHVAEMERELGVGLFARTSHSVTLTSAGEAAAAGFRRALVAYDRACDAAAEAAKGISGSITLGFLYYSMRDYGTPIVSALRRLYPDVHVKLLTGQPDQLTRWLLAGEADLIEVYEYDGFGPVPGGLACCKLDLASEDIWVLMDSENPLAQKHPLHWEDLQGSDYISGCRSYGNQNLSRPLFERYDVSPGTGISIDQVDSLSLELRGTRRIMLGMRSLEAAAGDGIACVPIEGPERNLVCKLIWLEDNENPCIPLVEAAWRYAQRSGLCAS